MPGRKKPSLLIHGIKRLYTMDPRKEGLGVLENASILVTKDGSIQWIGPSSNAPKADEVLYAGGLIAMPGLIDPHTHSVWAGSRANEFAQRLAGANYADILEQGGGILSTVAATRAATADALREHMAIRLMHMLKRGVTTVEVKSGYGLNTATELRMFRAMDPFRIQHQTVVRSFLGAHTVPAEHRSNRDEYVRQIIEEQLPVCAPEADFVDVYCDRGAFSLDESIAILTAGKGLGLKVRAHAEQVSYTGIAEAAANLGATALDHLERIDDAGIAAMAAAGTTAVLLPGAQLYLKDSSPPVEALREAGVPMAVGTDLNPGSSPVHDLWTAATLACLIQGLTIEEAVLGITRNAARALGLGRSYGMLRKTGVADIALFAPPPGEPATVESLIQHMGSPNAVHVVSKGRLVF
jgi:imidazolonepropionase